MKKICFLGVSFFLLAKAYSQDQSLINPNQSLLYTNPSFAGSNGSLRDQLVYRNMWPKLSSNSVSYYNGLDAYVKQLHGGLALSGLTNNQSYGELKSSQLNLIYAPYFECKKSGVKIIPSIQISYIHKQVDYSLISFGSTILPQWTSTRPSGTKNNFDFSSGLLANYKNLYVGGTVFHINQPDLGTLGASKLPSRISLNSSYNIPINEKTLLNFSAVYNSQQTYNSLQLSANAIFLQEIIVGLGFMSGDAVFVNLGCRNNYFYVSAGYDVVFSKLAGSTSGSWQLSMGLSLHKKTKGQLPENFEKW